MPQDRAEAEDEALPATSTTSFTTTPRARPLKSITSRIWRRRSSTRGGSVTRTAPRALMASRRRSSTTSRGTLVHRCLRRAHSLHCQSTSNRHQNMTRIEERVPSSQIGTKLVAEGARAWTWQCTRRTLASWSSRQILQSPREPPASNGYTVGRTQA